MKPFLALPVLFVAALAPGRAQAQADGAHDDSRLQAWPRTVVAIINSHWTRPPIAETGTGGCTAHIELAGNGDVMSVYFDPPCNPRVLQRSIEAAIIKSSPLPLPDDPALFRRHIVANFYPKDGT